MLRSSAKRMSEALAHRGPDGSGIWIDGSKGVGLAHRRLAILDPSTRGAQPMISASGRFVIAFNGEIYNHQDLRAGIEKLSSFSGWRGQSDTESLLGAIDTWGIELALQRSFGMFAFALWDRKRCRLILARDRIGEKPLYFGRSGQTLLFGSELKAITAFEEFDRTVDPVAVRDYLRLGYVPGERTIYEQVKRVPAGAFLTFDSPLHDAKPHSYWSLESVVRRGIKDRPQGESVLRDLADRTELRLRDVVESQMISDVPLGCFLSGGVDSTLITALMQTASTTPVRTFCIAFADRRFNEADHAARIARHLGTLHTEYLVTEAEALAAVADLPTIYDEPFADSSQIPTTLLSRLASDMVKVALTGDGGDEVFGGYNRYILAPEIWSWARRLPSGIRRLSGPISRNLYRMGRSEGSLLRRLSLRMGMPITTIDRLASLGEVLGNARTFPDIYHGLISSFQSPSSFMTEGPHTRVAEAAVDRWPEELSAAEWMMMEDTLGYLPGDTLVKVDRAAMSASLENRAPFLDARTLELAWSLPLQARIDGRTGKWILRHILDRHVPRSLMDRPKQGFAIPLDRWLRGQLRDWAEALLTRDRLERLSLLRPEPILHLWEEHQNGMAVHGQKLWNVLMLLAWFEEYARPNGELMAAC